MVATIQPHGLMTAAKAGCINIFFKKGGQYHSLSDFTHFSFLNRDKTKFEYNFSDLLLLFFGGVGVQFFISSFFVRLSFFIVSVELVR